MSEPTTTNERPIDAGDQELNLDAATLRRRLRELRDEIRVGLHLAGMDVRDAFEALEREAERVVNEVPAADERRLAEIATRLRRLAAELHDREAAQG